MGVDHTFIMAYICVYFACMEHTFIVILLECFVELYIFLLRRYMGLQLQYINPIEVLQYQYKGWKSRRYHIQIVGFTQHNSAMI
jgi:hypothetical protein